MIKPTLLKEELKLTDCLVDRLSWLRNIHGDRDVRMTRWKHHARKGDVRRHWDAQLSNSGGRQIFHVYFGHKDMAVQYKLAWGGQLVR